VQRFTLTLSAGVKCAKHGKLETRLIRTDKPPSSLPTTTRNFPVGFRKDLWGREFKETLIARYDLRLGAPNKRAIARFPYFLILNSAFTLLRLLPSNFRAPCRPPSRFRNTCEKQALQSRNNQRARASTFGKVKVRNRFGRTPGEL
jgi:hypothetical protein